jgi:hypothetical protein
MKIAVVSTGRNRCTLLAKYLHATNPELEFCGEFYNAWRDKDGNVEDPGSRILNPDIGGDPNQQIQSIDNLTDELFAKENYIVKIMAISLKGFKDLDPAVYRLEEYDQIHLIERHDFFEQCCSWEIALSTGMFHLTPDTMPDHPERKKRFEALKNEAYKILGSDTSEASYVQKLGMFADAEFLIFIKDLSIRTEQKAGGLTSTKVTIQAKAYDNCTAEGLGTVVFEGEWKTMPDAGEAARLSINSSIQSGYDRLMNFFNMRVGSWINGAPFELRFYGMGAPRNMRELINKLKSDSEFGGEMEPTMTGDFVKLNITYKKKPYDMYNKVLDFADAIPDMKTKQIDAKLLYGRQISFAPLDVPIKEEVERKKITGLK